MGDKNISRLWFDKDQYYVSRGGTFYPFTFEWVNLDYVSPLMGQTGKIIFLANPESGQMCQTGQKLPKVYL